MERKFEVTQFYQIGLSPRYFVKRGIFKPLELRHLQMMRQQLNRRFPQHKSTKNPATWRLTVETIDGVTSARLTGTNLDWSAVGTPEEISLFLIEHLSAEP